MYHFFHQSLYTESVAVCSTGLHCRAGIVGRVMSWITDPFRAAPQEGGGEENAPAEDAEEAENKQEEVIGGGYWSTTQCRHLHYFTVLRRLIYVIFSVHLLHIFGVLKPSN